MNKLIYLYALVLLSVGHLAAQLNESDTIKFQLRSSITGNYQKGNLDVFVLRGKLDFSLGSNKNFVFKSQNAYLYQSFYTIKTDDDLYSRNYLYWKPTNRVYPFAIAYAAINYRRKIDFRYFGGAGATVQLINKRFHVLKLSAGSVYEENTFRGSTYNYTQFDGTNKINVARATTYLGGWYYLLSNKLRLYYDAYWQPSFENTENYRWQGDVGFDFMLWKGLSFNALFVYTHENLTIKNIKQDDQMLTFGISYTFKANKK